MRPPTHPATDATGRAAPRAAPGISARGISKSFAGARGPALAALSDLSMDVAPGEFVAVIGPSGCGKTTLLRIIGGLERPDGGSVRIGDAGPAAAARDKAIGYVFQDPALLPWRTVLGNIRLPLEINSGAGGRGGRAEDVMDSVGLGDFGDYYPHQLSGGMRQRVALARAFAFDPSVLLMDEPLGSLDEITREAMRYELLGLWEASGKTVVFVTHSVAEAALLADRVVVMSDRPGRVVAQVPVEFPRPRDEALVGTVEFLELTSRVREALALGMGG